MLKVWVTGSSALVEPVAAGSTTTELAGIGEDAALVACAADRRSGCGDWGIRTHEEHKSEILGPHRIYVKETTWA